MANFIHFSYRGSIEPEWTFDGKEEEEEENTGGLTNMFLAQSTIDTLKSLRNSRKGCPYIEVICEELEVKWKTHCFRAIFEQFVAGRLQDLKTKIKTWNITPEFSAMGKVTENMDMIFCDLLLTPLGKFMVLLSKVESVS